MSAGFVTQPATNSSAYRPIRFTFRTAATSQLQERAEVVVQLGDNTEVGRFRLDYITRTPDGSDFRYNFECDIQAIAQALTIPRIDTMHPGARAHYEGTVISGPTSSVDLKIVVQFYRRDANVLIPVSGTITSNTITCWPIITQHNEQQDVGSRYVGSGSRNVLHRPYDAPIPIRLGDNFSMCIVQPASLANILVSRTNTAGTTDTVSINFPGGSLNSANDNKKILAVNVGPRGLQFLNLNAPVILADTARYTVQFRNASNVALSSVLSFVLTCPRANIDVRVGWMNDLGGFDTHTFSLSRVNFVESKSEPGAIPLNWPSQTDHKVFNKSKVKTSIVRDDVLEVTSEVLDRRQAQVISFVFSSPEVYIDSILAMSEFLNFYGAGVFGMYPVTVEDAQVTTYDSEEVSGSVITMRLRLSNPIYAQQL